MFDFLFWVLLSVVMTASGLFFGMLGLGGFFDKEEKQ